MKTWLFRTALGAVLVAGFPVAGFAFGGGGGDSGSGLSPYAVLSGNDRSAGINNGNYVQPRYNPYLQAYPPYGPSEDSRSYPVRRPAYGAPY